MSDGQGEGQGGEGGQGGGGGGAGGAGAAELLNAGGGAGGEGGQGGATAGSGDQGGQGEGQGATGGEGGQGGGAKWYETLSGDKPQDGGKSNREWAANKNYADPDAAIAALRGLESRFLAGDKLVLPKDGDPPEAIEAFHKAIGRPDEPTGYEVKAPEGAELDGQLVGKLQEVAFKNGVPKAAFEALAAAFNEHGMGMIDQAEGERAIAKQQGVEQLRREWGDKFDANISHANKAMKMLELDMDTVSGIEDGIGTVKTLQLLSKLGLGMGEDALLGEGSRKFSMDVSAAKAELDSMKKTPELAKRIMDGDKELTKRREYLQQVVSQHEAGEAARAAQS